MFLIKIIVLGSCMFLLFASQEPDGTSKFNQILD